MVNPTDDVSAELSWEQIVTDHSARVYRLAYRLTGSSHDAEDLTQEVFVRVFRSLHTYTPGTMEGWLHRITTNLFLDQARRKQRLRFDALSDEAASRLPSALPTPDVAQLDRMFDADVEAALASLAPDFRAAVVLCDVEGLTYEEIADVLGLKLGTVRSRIHRGRAQLRSALPGRGGACVGPRPDLPGLPPAGGARGMDQASARLARRPGQPRDGSVPAAARFAVRRRRVGRRRQDRATLAPPAYDCRGRGRWRRRGVRARTDHVHGFPGQPHRGSVPAVARDDPGRPGPGTGRVADR